MSDQEDARSELKLDNRKALALGLVLVLLAAGIFAAVQTSSGQGSTAKDVFGTGTVTFNAGQDIASGAIPYGSAFASPPTPPNGQVLFRFSATNLRIQTFPNPPATVVQSQNMTHDLTFDTNNRGFSWSVNTTGTQYQTSTAIVQEEVQMPAGGTLNATFSCILENFFVGSTVTWWVQASHISTDANGNDSPLGDWTDITAHSSVSASTCTVAPGPAAAPIVLFSSGNLLGNHFESQKTFLRIRGIASSGIDLLYAENIHFFITGDWNLWYNFPATEHEIFGSTAWEIPAPAVADGRSQFTFRVTCGTDSITSNIGTSLGSEQLALEYQTAGVWHNLLNVTITSCPGTFTSPIGTPTVNTFPAGAPMRIVGMGGCGTAIGCGVNGLSDNMPLENIQVLTTFQKLVVVNCNIQSNASITVTQFTITCVAADILQSSLVINVNFWAHSNAG